MKQANEVKATHFQLGNHNEPIVRDSNKIGSIN
jgi:hypothetical protein